MATGTLDYEALSKKYGIATPVWDTTSDPFWSSRTDRQNEQKRSTWQAAVEKAYSQEQEKNALTTEYQTAYNEAKSANNARYNQALALNDKVISAYSPNGSYGAGAMNSYERGKTQARATAYSGMVRAGTANLINGSGFDKSYEEEVGNNFRLNLQDRQTEGLTSAYNTKANTVASRVDSYPDQSLYVQLLQQLGNS
jgi:hypothetical protein